MFDFIIFNSILSNFKGIGIVSLANRTYAPMGILNTEILELLLKENVETTKPKETSSLLENTAKELIKVILEEKGNLASDLAKV